MKHQPEIAFYSNGNAFANPSQFADGAALHTRQRWLRRSQEKSACQPDSLQWLADDAGFESADIGSNVWQLWHRHQLACRTSAFATLLSVASAREAHNHF